MAKTPRAITSYPRSYRPFPNPTLLSLTGAMKALGSFQGRLIVRMLITTEYGVVSSSWNFDVADNFRKIVNQNGWTGLFLPF